MSPPASHDEARELTDCYTLLAARVHHYAMALTGGERALAEDVTQEVFCAAAVRWTKLRDLEDAERLVRLKRIARNKTIDMHRRRKTALGKQPGLVQAGDTDRDSTHDAAMLSIASSELWPALRRLPGRQRVIAVMRYWDQMTVRAIAAELGVSAGTVSGDLKKMHNALRGAVDDYFGPV